MKCTARIYKNGVYVLSPSGYLVDSCETKDFAGSSFEADLMYIGKGGRLDQLAERIDKFWGK